MLTVDGLVAGVHFFADDPPDAIAQGVARQRFDLAAKGPRAARVSLTLALPRDWRAEWLEAFRADSGEDAARAIVRCSAATRFRRLARSRFR